MQRFALSLDFKKEDWDPLFVIDWKCYKDLPAIACFFPNGLDPAHREANVNGFRKGVFEGPAERASANIRDEQSGDIIAFISCRVYRGDTGIIDGQFANVPPPTQLPQIKDLKDREYWEWFWTEKQLATRKIEELHTPVIVVQSICTDPTWQRHGAATMLLEWLLAFAGNEKLRVALQPGAFAVGIGFYEKFGFHVCHTQTFVNKERFPDRDPIEVRTMFKDVGGVETTEN